LANVFETHKQQAMFILTQYKKQAFDCGDCDKLSNGKYNKKETNEYERERERHTHTHKMQQNYDQKIDSSHLIIDNGKVENGLPKP
jgi:hypothetical protein